MTEIKSDKLIALPGPVENDAPHYIGHANNQAYQAPFANFHLGDIYSKEQTGSATLIADEKSALNSKFSCRKFELRQVRPSPHLRGCCA